MKVFIVSCCLAASLFAVCSLSYASESDVDKLLDLLIKRRVLTPEDAAEFRGELAVKKQEEKRAQKEFTIMASKPIKVSGYIQGRYRQGKDIKDSFDIRRARLDLKGDITERFDYRTQIEFGGTSGPFLLDAILGYKVAPYLKLAAGQFKIPFSMENLTSSPKLETINRSQVVEALVARSGDIIGNQNGRDIGAQASGGFWRIKDFDIIEYAFGVFNGSGINRYDLNDQKDLVGRLVVHPIKDVSIGGSFYKGKYTLSSAPGGRYDRDRAGAEFAYVHDPVSLKAEYIAGKDDTIKRQGWYIQCGYFLIPNVLQGVFKFDSYDPNLKNGSKDQTDIYTLGINYFFNKWAFLQVDYELKNERGGANIDNDTFIGQMTMQF